MEEECVWLSRINRVQRISTVNQHAEFTIAIEGKKGNKQCWNDSAIYFLLPSIAIAFIFSHRCRRGREESRVSSVSVAADPSDGAIKVSVL